MFVISPSMTRSVGYDMRSVRLPENAIPTIFHKLGDDKPERISSLMDKLNRKLVCMGDNREQTIGHSAVQAFVNKVKFHLFIKQNVLGILQASDGCVL